MKFLTVLIIVFLYRNWVGGHPVRDRVPSQRYIGWFLARDIADNLRYLLCVGVPVVIAFIISVRVGDWLYGLIWLVFALAVMLYAVDIHDAEANFDDQAEWLREQDNDADLAAVRDRQVDFVQATNYEIFQSIYPALFWFLVLGPGGALAYVLSKQYLEALKDDGPALDLVDRVVYFMEWPAVRVSGFIFALLGHFGRCFEAWIASFGELHEPTDTVLMRLAQAAIDIPVPQAGETAGEFAIDSESANEQLHKLLDRSLFGWLGFAAIMAIIGF